MSFRQTAILGYKWNLTSAVTAVLFQALQVYYTSRFLSPEDFGLWGILVLISGFVLISNDVGIRGAIIHYQQISKERLSSLYWLTVFAGVAFALVIVLLIPVVQHFFRLQNLSGYFCLVAVTVITYSLGRQFEIIFQKEFRFRRLSVVDTISAFSGFISVILLLHLGFKVGALVFGGFATAASRTAILVYFGWKESRPLLHFRRRDLKGFVGYGFFQLGERNLEFFCERFDQIMIGRMLGTGPLGIYSFAFNLIYQPISKVNPIINKISLPIYAKIQHNSDEVKKVFFKKLRILTYANASLLLGMLAISYSTVWVVFGSRWEQSIVLIQLLSVVFLLKSIWNPIGNLLLALGKASTGFYWNILLVVVTVPAIIISSLAGHVNYVGLGLVCAQLVLFVPGYFMLVRPAVGKCFRQFTGAVLKPLLFSAIMCATVYFTGYWLTKVSSLSFTVLGTQVLVGFILQVSLMLLFDRQVCLDIISFLPSKWKQKRAVVYYSTLGLGATVSA